MSEIPRYTPIEPAPAIACLSTGELKLLAYINDAGRVDASYEAVAEALGLTKTAATANAKRLAEKNIISLKQVGWDHSQKKMRMERAAPNLIDCVWDADSEWVVQR